MHTGHLSVGQVLWKVAKSMSQQKKLWNESILSCKYKSSGFNSVVSNWREWVVVFSTIIEVETLLFTSMILEKRVMGLSLHGQFPKQ